MSERRIDREIARTLVSTEQQLKHEARESMSNQTAKDFLVKIATDEEAAKKAQAAHESALLALARQMGYTFSEGDLRQAMDDVEALDQLSGEQLDRVAGGRRRSFIDT
jgi:predicted ribosomally synthesized peptide with nif11-like leader